MNGLDVVCISKKGYSLKSNSSDIKVLITTT